MDNFHQNQSASACCPVGAQANFTTMGMQAGTAPNISLRVENAVFMGAIQPAVPPAPASPKWVLHCDGSAFPNPGNMGLGATLTAPDGQHHQLSVAAGGTGCNNEAEARAVMAALQHAASLGAKNLVIHSDSRVVVDQLTGDGGRPIERLHALFTELRMLLARFEESTVKWIPQHRNSEADALARAAAGLPPRPVATPRKAKVRRA